MNTKREYILWLPSWYPNRFDLFTGDFIQRHAVATAFYCPVTVIHFAAPGECVSVPASTATVSESEHLKEIIVYNTFKPTGIKIVDKVVYNIRFYKSAQKFIKQYFAEHGLPKIVHVHVPVKAGNIARWIKKEYDIPYLVSEHASYYMQEAETNFYQRHALYKKQVAKVFQKAILVTNVSAAIGNVIKQLFRLKQVAVIHNTVDTAYFNYSDSKADVFTFIHVSTLTAQKNIMGILKSFVRLRETRKDWKLKIVGPASAAILNFMQQNKLETHIELTGEVPYKDVATHLKTAHAMVLFSRHENFPCVVIEALCCGVPVVSSDVAGICEAVNDANGILIPSGDENALRQALLDVMKSYGTYDHVAISKEAIERYSYQTIGRRIFNLYYPTADYGG